MLLYLFFFDIRLLVALLGSITYTDLSIRLNVALEDLIIIEIYIYRVLQRFYFCDTLLSTFSILTIEHRLELTPDSYKLIKQYDV